MSQKKSHLSQLLEKWKSHNDVYARPADKMLYELFSELINKLDSHEQAEPEAPAPPQTMDDTTDDGDTGPGQNHPEDPSGKP